MCMNGKRSIAEDVAVVDMVSVVLTAPPLGVALEGLNEQLAPVGKPLQLVPLNVMVWLNPPVGVIVIVAVPCCPGEPIVTVVGLAATVKSGEGITGGVNLNITPTSLLQIPEPPELVVP